MLTFLQTLLTDGQPLIDPGREKAEAWMHTQLEQPRQKLDELLLQLLERDKIHFPGECLPYHSEAAQWALRLFFQGSCYYVFREIETSLVQSTLAEPMPSPQNSAAHFSAHLVMRHLPKLIQLSRRVADGDPLVTALESLALQIPYSVPSQLTAESNLDPILTHAGLAQSWLERFIEEGHPLPNDPRIETLLDQLCGHHRNDILPTRYHFTPSS
ncbi:hypothetical protein AAFN60_11705 [Roseibacillus persicicus]|uniref:hypothetical protein n=1 Tax=Roseibacillus persicicus TaxID=454148 RepID=UPI00398B1E7D